MIIRSILEFMLIVFTVACVANEPKIASWERRMFSEIRKAVRK